MKRPSLMIWAAIAANAVLADIYTWTGSASDVWNKTDANWDKGVWVDGNIAAFLLECRQQTLLWVRT